MTLPAGPTGAGEAPSTSEREALTEPGTRRRTRAPADVVSRTALMDTTAFPSTSPPRRVKEIAPAAADTCATAMVPSVEDTAYFSPSRTVLPPASWSPVATIVSVATLSAASESAGADRAIGPEGVLVRSLIETVPVAPARSAVRVAAPA